MKYAQNYLRSVVYSILMIIVGCFAANGQDEPQVLQPNKTIERELLGGQSHTYKFEIKAKEYLNVKVEQKGIDVVVRLFDKDGKQLAEMDSPNGTDGFENLTLIVDDAGVYTVEVGSLEAGSPKGSYSIFRETPRTATEKDKKNLRAKIIFDEAYSLYNQSTAESYKAALEKFGEASSLYAEIDDKSENLGLSLFISGLILDNLGDRANSLKFYERAIAFFKANDYKKWEATAFNSIGLSYNLLGENQKALDYLNQALAILRKFGDKSEIATTLTTLGLVYNDLGENQKALELFGQALPLYREAGDREGEAGALNNTGLVYKSLGENQKALEFYKLALTILRQDGNKRGEATMLNNIGLIYSAQGENQKALEVYKQALPLYKEVGFKLGEASALHNIGSFYDSLGEKQKALEFFGQALEIYRQAGNKAAEARTLNNIGGVYNDLGDNQKALKYFQDALLIRNTIGDKAGQANTLDSLMVYWKNLNKPQLAVFYGKQSVNVYQELRANIKGLDKDIQKTYLKSVEINYRFLADLLISESRLTEAEAVLDLLKEGEFSGLTKRGGETEDSVPYSKAETAALNVVDRLAALGREKGELVEKNEKSSLSDAEKQRFREITAEIESAETEFGKSLDALADEKTKGRNLDGVTQEARAFMGDLKELGGGAVALYTVIVGDSKTLSEGEIKTGWIILVTPEFRKAYPIDVKDLEKTVFDFRSALLSSKYDPRPIAQTLYTKLFLQKSGNLKTTLAADLNEYFKNKKEKTLMWSLDGVLRYVPMAALYDGDSYLVEKYRHTIFTTASKGRLKDTPKTNWTALGLGVSDEREESGKTFPKLPGTKRELEGIIKEKSADGDKGILPGTINLDEKFTAETMQDALAFDKNPVVHIASHFSFDRGDFNESFLLLGKGKLTVGQMDKKLNLFSNVDLLTLSACDTAVGNANGKEIEGFAYIAQSLGAKSVLASLWQIADTGTDELMIRFYKLRKENPQMPKGEAFRQAQLAMLGGKDLMTSGDSTENRSGVFSVEGQTKLELPKFKEDNKKPFAHPHYWAAFVLIGNWR